MQRGSMRRFLSWRLAFVSAIITFAIMAYLLKPAYDLYTTKSWETTASPVHRGKLLELHTARVRVSMCESLLSHSDGIHRSAWWANYSGSPATAEVGPVLPLVTFSADEGSIFTSTIWQTKDVTRETTSATLAGNIAHAIHPLNMLVVTASIFAVALTACAFVRTTALSLHSRVARRRQRCANCGYALVGLLHPLCPECGVATPTRNGTGTS